MCSANAPTPGSAKALLAAGTRCENLLQPPCVWDGNPGDSPAGGTGEGLQDVQTPNALQPLIRTSRGVLAAPWAGRNFRPRSHPAVRKA